MQRDEKSNKYHTLADDLADVVIDRINGRGVKKSRMLDYLRERGETKIRETIRSAAPETVFIHRFLSPLTPPELALYMGEAELFADKLRERILAGRITKDDLKLYLKTAVIMDNAEILNTVLNTGINPNGVLNTETMSVKLLGLCLVKRTEQSAIIDGLLMEQAVTAGEFTKFFMIKESAKNENSPKIDAWLDEFFWQHPELGRRKTLDDARTAAKAELAKAKNNLLKMGKTAVPVTIHPKTEIKTPAVTPLIPLPAKSSVSTQKESAPAPYRTINYVA